MGRTPELVDQPILVVDALAIQFPKQRAQAKGVTRRAVDGVNFTLERNETLALVGESGSGKSTTARAIMGVGPRPVAGHVYFEGREQHLLSRAERRVRSGRLQMVFQSPSGSLNPRMRVRQSIEEPLIVHGLSRVERAKRVDELLESVGLSAGHGRKLPRELSGGQQQRVGIARALALRPSLLMLDEPLSALDVSVQAQIVNLLLDLQDALGLSYLFISHDLAVVAGLAHRIAVMYMGKIVETGPTRQLLTSPVHPYTRSLLSAVPISDPRQRGLPRSGPAAGASRTQEDPAHLSTAPACAFAPRCWKAQQICFEQAPQFTGSADPAHSYACHFPEHLVASSGAGVAKSPS